MRNERAGARLPNLDGEPPMLSVADREVAHGWANAYSRILDFERTVLDRMRELRDRSEPRLHPVIDRTNIAPIEELVAAFAARQRAWRERAESLPRSGDGGDDVPPV